MKQLLLTTTFVCLCLVHFLTHAQQIIPKYYEIKIQTGDNGLELLNQNGISPDHFKRLKDGTIQVVYSERELSTLKKTGLPYEIIVDDMTKHYLNNIQNQPSLRANSSNCADIVLPKDTVTVPDDFTLGTMGGFFKYDEMLGHLTNMAEKYPNLITIKEQIGDYETHEGRPIYWVKISDNPYADESSNETQVLMTAIHHAREPASLSQLIFYMYYLLENYDKSDMVKHIVDSKELFFVPCINPDGYIYNQTTNPNGGGFWRKNRRNNGDGTYGVDLNRNYAYEWGGEGASSSTSSDTYRGPSPFSEPETQAIKYFCEQHNFSMAFNNHTYSELLLYPYGYTDNAPTPENEAFEYFTELMVEVNSYANQISADLYPASGVSDDWMYGEQFTKNKIYAMTPEIGNAFWLSQSDIIPVCKEMVWQNLSMNMIADQYVSFKEVEGNNDDNSDTESISFEISSAGVNDVNSATISLLPNSNEYIESVGDPAVFNSLEPYTPVTGNITYELAPNVPSGVDLNFIFKVSYGNTNLTYTVTKKTGENAHGTSLFTDNFTDTQLWDMTGSWGTTSSDYISDPASITDSPSGNYANNTNSSIIMKDAIDLTEVEDVFVRFKAKWELETGYDYVRMNVISGSNTTSMCGKYTSDVNSSVIGWHGSKDWVTEVISLNEFIGQSIKLEFEFYSDGGSVDDGFYIDDLEIIETNSNEIAFKESTALLGAGNHFSGVPMAVVDMNADGMDDLVRLQQARDLSISFQEEDGSFSTLHHGEVSSNFEWSMTVADVDKNGYNDILTAGHSDLIKILKSNDDNSAYNVSTLPEVFFIQGSNFVDIDNDRWVDIFACDDDAANKVYHNDGTGNFTLSNSLITTNPSAGNYASIWTDYDNDGDLDLYISKCRQGVTDPTDERRVNLLYRNDGNGFTEVGEIAGVANGAQSWASDFADIDNDGDLDFYLINHHEESTLYENNGDGTFTDITEGSGITSSSTLGDIQVTFKDFNNDGFVDLLVGGQNDKLYENNGDNTFTEIEDPFSGSHPVSFATGDLNHDGFIDIYASFHNLFNQPSSLPDQLFINSTNANNWVGFKLTGSASNINGIGARLELYGAWGKQIREIRAGESYGVHNSFFKVFGIGQANEISHLIIRWPSGIVQTIDNPDINQYHNILESDIAEAPNNFTITADKTFETTLNWEINPEDNTSVHTIIERKRVGSPSYTEIARLDISQTSFTDSKLKTSQNYVYRLKTINEFSTSPYSIEVEVTTSQFVTPNVGIIAFASGFSSPVDITNAGDNRLFVVEKQGKIKITDENGNVSSTPFLDISDAVKSTGSEQGLLGLAFHPDYTNNGYFFVHYIDNNGNSKISRFSVSGDPDFADPASELEILTVEQPFANHNAGDLSFGPDGYLYIGMGDGGSGGDPLGNGQNRQTLLGKILRIDIDNGSPYSIPESNPFTEDVETMDEIWALGLRNPWRFSFDKLSGDLWIGDVGQSAFEEINFQPANSVGGENYGWRCYEGNSEFNTTDCADISNFTFPVVEIDHSGSECSITGGFVYRGSDYPDLYGHYIFTDYCSGRIWTVYPDGEGNWETIDQGTFAQFAYSTFGQNSTGEVFLGNLSNGTIYKIEELNSPPTFITSPITIINEDEVYRYDFTATDENPNLTFEATTLPSWITLIDNNDGSGFLTGIPDNSSVGNNDVVLTVSDGEIVTEQIFTITVNNVNDAPEFITEEIKITNEDELYLYNIETEDIDAGSSVSLTINELPSWLSFTDNGNKTAILTGTPGNDDVGDYNIVITADDGIETTEQIFTLKVNNVNDLAEFTSSPLLSATEDNEYSYNISVTDIDAEDQLSFFTVDLPSWLSLMDNKNGTALLSGTPLNENVGNNDIIIKVYDGSEFVIQEFTIVVENTNDAPEFNSEAKVDAKQDQNYNYDIVVTDIDTDAITFESLTIPTWLTFNDNGDGTASLKGTPSNAEVGSHDVIINATDGIETITQAFTIVVENVNDAPTIEDQTLSVFENSPEGTVVGSLTASDLDNDPFTFSIFGSEDFVINSETGEISVATETNLDFETKISYQFSVTIRETQENGLSATATITVNIDNVTETPSAPTDLHQIVLAGDKYPGVAYLAWTDNADNETGFIIERSEENANNFEEIVTLDANTTRYDDYDVFNNTTYHYRIKAFNTDAQSDYSNVLDAGIVSGLEFNDISLSVNSYPNPVDKELNILIDNNLTGAFTLKVLNLKGQIIDINTFNKASNQFKTKIDVSGYSKGLYIIQIIQGNNRAIKRFVKE